MGAGSRPKMLSEVRRVMQSGRHTPLALKHYEAGRVSAEVVAECVSQDATGSDAATSTLLPAVRFIFEETEARVAASQMA